MVKERKKIRGEILICRVNRNAKFPVRWYVDRFRNYSKYAELYIKIYIISVRIFAWIQFTLDNFGDIPRRRVEGGRTANQQRRQERMKREERGKAELILCGWHICCAEFARITKTSVGGKRTRRVDWSAGDPYARGVAFH